MQSLQRTEPQHTKKKLGRRCDTSHRGLRKAKKTPTSHEKSRGLQHSFTLAESPIWYLRCLSFDGDLEIENLKEMKRKGIGEVKMR